MFMPRISACSRMLPRTLRHSSSAARWNTNPMSCLGPVTRSPRRCTDPALGAVSPATALSRVDLPHPDGPAIVMSSPACTSSSMPSNALTRPRLEAKVIDRSLTCSTVEVSTTSVTGSSFQTARDACVRGAWPRSSGSCPRCERVVEVVLDSSLTGDQLGIGEQRQRVLPVLRRGHAGCLTFGRVGVQQQDRFLPLVLQHVGLRHLRVLAVHRLDCCLRVVGGGLERLRGGSNHR